MRHVARQWNHAYSDKDEHDIQDKSEPTQRMHLILLILFIFVRKTIAANALIARW